MEDKFAMACNVVEYASEDVRKHAKKRIFAVVDGRSQEFQRELDQCGLTRVKEWFHYQDHRTGCFIRFYKVRPEEGNAFQKAALDLAEHMPALGYHDYKEYSLKTLVEFDCIPSDVAQAQTGMACEEPETLDYFPDALFNVAGMRTDPPRSLYWKDVMIIEGREQEGRRFLSQRGFDNLKIAYAVSHKNWPQYVLFGCAIPKKRWDEFVDVMYDLEKRMLILGYRDYEDACTELFRLVKESGNES